MFEVIVAHKIDADMIEDLVTTMVECNDMTASWCREYDAKGQHAAEAIVGGYTVIFTVDNPDYDASEKKTAENWPTLRKEVDSAVIKKALDLCGIRHPQVLINFIGGNYDANDADVILQLAIYEEVVFC